MISLCCRHFYSIPTTPLQNSVSLTFIAPLSSSMAEGSSYLTHVLDQAVEGVKNYSQRQDWALTFSRER